MTSVSAQLGRTNDTLVLQGNSVTYFVTKSHPGLGYVTAAAAGDFDVPDITTWLRHHLEGAS